jgi:peptidoglycan hydrolase-like protein with peptidoglycan-binding domain
LEKAFDNDPALRRGDTDKEAVRLVQEGLRDDGFAFTKSLNPDGTLNGIYGEETAANVKAFQTKHRLPLKEGVTGRQTLGKLDELALARTPPATPPPGLEIERKSFESDPDKIYFLRGQSIIPDDIELGKVPPFATPPKRKLTLKGFSSEDEDPRVAKQRIETVAVKLHASGLKAKPIEDAQPSSSAGQFDYPNKRMVQIIPQGATSEEPNCKVTPPTTPCRPEMEVALAAGRKRADDLLDAATKGLDPLTPNVSSHLKTHFKDRSARTAANVKTNLTRLKAELAHLATPNAHDCQTPCDSHCRTETAHMNEKIGTDSRMTLCDKYLPENDDEHARDLIHEASHGTDVIGGKPKYGTEDLSMLNHRMFKFLSKGEALRNADTYAIFVLDVSGVKAGSPAPVDKPTGLSKKEETAVQHALALIQARTVRTHGDLKDLYSTIHKLRSSGDTKAWTGTRAEYNMRIVAPLFGLTLPPLLPTMRDQVGVAGLRERVAHLSNPIYRSIEMRKVPARVTTWSVGPGQQVDLGTDFFALGLKVGDNHVRLLVAKLARVTPEIPTEDEPKYVAMIQQIGTLP